jgi:hypothetical protein
MWLKYIVIWTDAQHDTQKFSSVLRNAYSNKCSNIFPYKYKVENLLQFLPNKHKNPYQETVHDNKNYI